MATFADALAITIGLDPSAFNKGSAQVNASMRKTREAAQKEGAGVEKAMDKASESLERLARNTLKLLAIFTAGRAIKDFVADITQADSALGRLAQRLGQAPSDIAAVASAVQRAGGSYDGAAGSFQRFSDSIQELKTTGNTGILPFLYRVQAAGGKQINLNRKMSDTFHDLADNLKVIHDTQGAATANYMGQQLGLDPDLVAQLVQGGDAYDAMVAKSKRLGIASKADTDAARQRTEAWRDLNQVFEDFGRKVSTAVTPAIVDLLRYFQDLVVANKDWLQTNIVGGIKEFVTWLKSLDWEPIKQGIKAFIDGCAAAVAAVGGWTHVVEGLFGLWALEKVGKVLAAIALIRKALVLGDSSLLAAMLRVGLPVAIGAAAMGHGFQTAEEYAEAKKTDPETKKFDDERIGQRDRVRGAISRGWNRVKRIFGGGEAEAADGAAGIRTRAHRAARGDQSGGVAANPGAYKDVLDHIARSEGTASQPGGGYNTSLGYGRYLPGGKEQSLTGKTLDEILALGNSMRRQPGNPNSSALGRYQIVGDTLRDQMRKLGLKGTDLFDEKTQDRIGANLARQRGANAAGLRQEWASLVGAKNATAVALMQKVDPKASTMPLPTQRDKDIVTIQAAAKDLRPGASTARRPDILADPKDERRQVPAAATAPSAWNGIPAAAAAVVQVHAAQAAQASRVSNDNRSAVDNSSATTFNGGITVNTHATDGHGIASDLQESFKKRSFAMGANYGQA
ncbi:hypothetical protein [Methylobacterium sp. J-077]|uniref:hypothetical protein n=1 Tax=Methylobacterium sp. J-077 TaxID=2836656 RepID=UPI001FBB2CA2|nr:hypothetical protein [Methylobacterium sp. J-077]MCJ2126663.1 hypothetical protein [Methylobacterium sp. J-077]